MIRTSAKRILLLGIGSLTCVISSGARASTGTDLLSEAQKNYSAGQYYTAARYGYAAAQDSTATAGQGNAWAAISLVRAGLYQSSTYFFIKALESGDREAIRRVLTQTETLLSRVGADFLREYLIRHTRLDDYNDLNRSALLFSLGKAALLKADENKAIEYLNKVRSESTLYPHSLQLRATALAIQGRPEEAIDDFQDCQKYAELVISERDTRAPRYQTQVNESRDLRARCQAGEARVLYQSDKFDEAEAAYERIPKASFVWPDILFEQAWNSFAKREFNRTLGKLVSYKAPALQFVFNSEIEVLRAQSYLSLCLYEDTDKALSEFTSRYTEMGRQVKRFAENNSSNLESMYLMGLQALKGPLTTKEPIHQMANRFVRGPYFPGLVAQEASLEKERSAISQFARMSGASSGGLTAFLGEVLKWRKKAIRALGGAFVKNSLIDHHTQLVADFEKISFIRLEMLSRAKERLVRQSTRSAAEEEERVKGNIEPKRKDHQMYWSFNGEFWNDELGDYVFGLETQCER